MSARDLTDAVVAAARAGDGQAFRVVYETLGPGIAGYVRAKGAADPEATVNDVFLALLPQLSAVRDGAKGLRRLVFTIAHARVVDELRQRSRRPVSVPFDQSVDARRHVSAEDAAAALGTDSELISALRALPADQCEALLLRVVADLSIEDVARIMGRSRGAIKQLQRRALVELRATVNQFRVTP